MNADDLCFQHGCATCPTAREEKENICVQDSEVGEHGPQFAPLISNAISNVFPVDFQLLTKRIPGPLVNLVVIFIFLFITAILLPTFVFLLKVNSGLYFINWTFKSFLTRCFVFTSFTFTMLGMISLIFILFFTFSGYIMVHFFIIIFSLFFCIFLFILDRSPGMQVPCFSLNEEHEEAAEGKQEKEVRSHGSLWALLTTLLGFIVWVPVLNDQREGNQW
ncbi:hypothetical protein TSMEX_003006 [Taenia solium]|eukprot:TsM_000975000 transcript=TsM_000975000 gene=TsM_000975000